ncbi:hypothetical protein CKA32_005487 [Geitlerinema sp. FC II]|nr:hypothetical protein CKA32_005487 [Geitlerinema sp. FC II]
MKDWRSAIDTLPYVEMLPLVFDRVSPLGNKLTCFSVLYCFYPLFIQVSIVAWLFTSDRVRNLDSIHWENNSQIA